MKKLSLLLFAFAFTFLSAGKINADTVYVNVMNNFYSPANFTVNVGDQVKWTLMEGTHTTSSMVIPGGAATWNYTFTGVGDTYVYNVTVAGSYSYECLFHPGMEGTFDASIASGPRLVENFEYGSVDDTSLVSLTSNWVRHSGAMGPAYSATSLSYAAYPSSGIGGAVTFLNGSSGNNDGDIHRTFNVIDVTQNVYASFLLELSSAMATADYFFHVGPSPIATTFRGRVFARANAPGWSFGLSKSSELRTDDNTILNFNQTYLVVLKYSYNPTAADDDQVTLYVYESGVPITEPGTPLVTIGPLGTGTGSDPVNIGAVAIRQGTNTPTGKIDGIRITTSWSDIVPVELTSFTAAAIGNNVTLNWSTASEINNSGFNVERRNASSDWNSIGFVQGNGTTTEAKQYSFVDNSVSAGNYSYRLKQIDFDGTFEYSNSVEVEVSSPAVYELAQNYPNPFNPSTTIQFSLPKSSNVLLKVYNLLGQEVATLLDGFREAGVHFINFDAVNLNSGLYIYKIEADGFSTARKMTLIK